MCGWGWLAVGLSVGMVDELVETGALPVLSQFTTVLAHTSFVSATKKRVCGGVCGGACMRPSLARSLSLSLSLCVCVCTCECECAHVHVSVGVSL
jgi:hypothetical protein